MAILLSTWRGPDYRRLPAALLRTTLELFPAVGAASGLWRPMHSQVEEMKLLVVEDDRETASYLGQGSRRKRLYGRSRRRRPRGAVSGELRRVRRDRARPHAARDGWARVAGRVARRRNPHPVADPERARQRRRPRQRAACRRRRLSRQAVCVQRAVSLGSRRCCAAARRRQRQRPYGWRTSSSTC